MSTRSSLAYVSDDRDDDRELHVYHEHLDGHVYLEGDTCWGARFRIRLTDEQVQQIQDGTDVLAEEAQAGG